MCCITYLLRMSSYTIVNVENTTLPNSKYEKKLLLRPM